MTSRALLVLFVLSAITMLGACAQPTLEQQMLEDVSAALGGLSRIEAVATLSIEGEGVMGNLGQDLTPDATSQTFAISDYRQLADLTTGRMRVERTRTPNFNYFRGPDPIKQVFGIDGDVAYDVAPDGSATTNATASARRAAYYHHPLTLVRAAWDQSATSANARTTDGESLLDITTADGLVFTLAIDAATKLPSSVTSRLNHPNLRDVSQRTSFADYEDVNGLMLPTGVTELTDDYQIIELRVTAQSVDGDVGDLAAPDAATSATPISGPPPATVTAEEVTDGVWFLADQSHHSVLVELSDHLMLIEAPNEVRTLAVIAKARELVPDKPLTHLVNTHHHFDHSAGIRAAVSEGLVIVTHDRTHPSTANSRNGRAPSLPTPWLRTRRLSRWRRSRTRTTVHARPRASSSCCSTSATRSSSSAASPCSSPRSQAPRRPVSCRPSSYRRGSATS